MTIMELEQEPRIIPFDIDYLRARAMFQRQKRELVMVHGSKEYRFQPSLPRDAARMSFYKILIEQLKDLPEDARMSLRLCRGSISPTHYTITRENKEVDLQFHLISGSYRALTTLVEGDTKTPVCNLGTPSMAEFRKEIKKALHQSYAHLGLESHLR